jgi:hypothetical protein
LTFLGLLDWSLWVLLTLHVLNGQLIGNHKEGCVRRKYTAHKTDEGS